MKTNILLVLDNRRAKQDGTYPILLRIVHHRVSSQISTGIFVKEKDWDSKGRKIKPSYRGTESVARLNNQLLKKKTEAVDIVTKLDEQKRLDSLSVIQLKELIERKVEKLSVLKFTEKLIADMKEAHQLGNARAYQSVLGILKTTNKGKDLTFQDLNYHFLLKLEQAHYAKGNEVNGLAFYMRTIRAIYNKAIKQGLADKEMYPFANYQIKSTKTRKRAITIEAIRKIESLIFEPSDPLFHTRNYFLLSFYMRGITFADLAYLKMSSLVDGRIIYQRKKTDKPYNIKITDEIKALLDCYISDQEKDDFIFPIIKRESEEDQYKSVLLARKRFNKKLKKIAELCDIQENLTSYVSRHSFATRAKNLGVPIATISDMLGHADTKTTEVYLDSLPSDIMDDFHEKVIR